MIANDDDELFTWLRTAAGYTGRPGGGSFVAAIAEAGLHADAFNYAILRPALLQFKAKYPKYADEGEGSEAR